MKTTILSIFFLTISLFSSLYSMNFSINQNYRGYNLIYASGKIHHGDLNRLKYNYSRISKSRQAILVLNSDGGALNEGLKIGRFLKEHRIATAVRKNGICASSCALAFLGGRSLRGSKLMILPRGTKLGFHSFYYRNGNRTNAALIQADMASLLDYMHYVNAPYSITKHTYSTNFHKVYWVSNRDRRSLGLASSLSRLSFRNHRGSKTQRRQPSRLPVSPRRQSAGYALTQTKYIRYYFSKINALLSANQGAYYSDNIALNDITNQDWLRRNLKYAYVKNIKLLSANQVNTRVIYALQNGKRICSENNYRLSQSSNGWRIQLKQYRPCSHSSRRLLRKFASVLP